MSVLCRDLQYASVYLLPGCRRTTWARSRVLSQRSGKRSLHAMHERRKIMYPIEGGVGDFLPPEALKTVVEFQDGLLERLNEQVKETSLVGKPVLQIIADTANDAELIQAHNYACLAANNSFFLDSVKPPSGNTSNLDEDRMNEDRMPADLKGIINSQFPGISTLKERFVASAAGMVSSGWLWLVTDLQGGLAVVPTFGAGTLLVRSRQHWKAVEQETVARQAYGSELFKSAQSGSSLSSTTPSSPVSGVKAAPKDLHPSTPSRSLSKSAYRAAGHENPSVRDPNISDGGTDQWGVHRRGGRVYPLCVLSLFEHTWMSAGLGVWGKEEYVRRFFNVVDWEKVYKIYTEFSKPDDDRRQNI